MIKITNTSSDHGVISIYPGWYPDEVGIRDLFVKFFASVQKRKDSRLWKTMQNMEAEEERGSVGEENSQKDVAADETSRQTERSQTPQLRSDRGSDDDDDKEDEREEQTSGSLWGHARLPPSVYGNNPPPGGKRMGKANAVWEVVKHLKERTVDGEVVDAKYSHVCISPITAAEAGEQGPDVDSHGNSLWFCNKLFSLSKTKNCYRSSQATLANIGAMNAESFCERILSCASLVVTDLHTSLDHEEVRMLTMLRMNKSLMEYMRKEYDNLHSHIEASETRITKHLRDKAEVQAQEAATMDEEY